MRLLRPLIIGFPILLAGCSTLSDFSWSSLSPFNWFGNSATVGDGGVGKVSAATPLEKQSLDNALGGDYHLRGGMETHNGGIIAFYQAVKNDKVEMTFYGHQAGKVERVEVTGTAIASDWGVKVGTPFSTVYDKAYGACVRGEGEDRVVCAAKQSAHVSYVFSGSWHGPDELMPSDDALKSWQVSKIVWRATASPDKG